MSGAKAFLAGILTAAAVSAAVWFLRVRPALDAAEGRAQSAEEAARKTRREASDAQLWAESERERNRLGDERVKELERALTGTRPEQPGTPAATTGHEPPPLPDVAPEDWDRNRLNQEIENLARAPQVVLKHQRYPLVLKALAARKDESVELLSQMLRSGLDAPLIATAATLASGLGDARLVPPLLARWKIETDDEAKRSVLRALANLPGDEAVPVLLAVWSDPAAERQLRVLAIHGLGVRGHEVARRAADGRTAATPPQRIRAIESLRSFAQRSEWKDVTLVPVFSKALRTADGPAQRKLSLIALEGFWSKDALADLDAFAGDPASPADLAQRSRNLAEALRAGKPRPETAGTPERGLPQEGDE
jgi:hypothetical protein